MDHVHAYQFCKNLTNYLNITSTKVDPYLSDMLSVHDHLLMHEVIMPGILKVIDEIFWIGGMYKVVEGHHHRQFSVSKWTDRSPFTLKYFHQGHFNRHHHIRLGDRFCIIIAFNSGRWDLRPCNEKLFFACQIIKSNMPIDAPRHEKPLKSPYDKD
uniref:C-type lectin-like protein n=1 Tax=Schmidtea mediterranea TaxID=79327 RepID=A0A1W6I197_SCHMD|nr:C-type lectin-like protein [Schmidtea mediterranea]